MHKANLHSLYVLAFSLLITVISLSTVWYVTALTVHPGSNPISTVAAPMSSSE